MDCLLIEVSPKEAAENLSSALGVRTLIEQNGPKQTCSLGESWCGIHYVLTAEVPFPRQEAIARGISWDPNSLENVLMGGTPTSFMSSFGPARYLSAIEVARYSLALRKVSSETFAHQYDPEGLYDNEIPPGDWDSATRRDWLLRHFNELKIFFASAAAHQNGILIDFV
jgi:hypothetical protein